MGSENALGRLSTRWNHLIEKETLGFYEFEHVSIEKAATFLRTALSAGGVLTASAIPGILGVKPPRERRWLGRGSLFTSARTVLMRPDGPRRSSRIPYQGRPSKP
jgi:hypothetical protein